MYPDRKYPSKDTMIAKIKVPANIRRTGYRQQGDPYTLDYSQVIKKAEDMGFPHAAEWLRNNEQLYKMGFARGFEPE